LLRAAASISRADDVARWIPGHTTAAEDDDDDDSLSPHRVRNNRTSFVQFHSPAGATSAQSNPGQDQEEHPGRTRMDRRHRRSRDAGDPHQQKIQQQNYSNDVIVAD
jgi:hypothetical protein